MPIHVVIGAPWGDEGKGKIVDNKCVNARAAVRFQGGPNAGHTIVIGQQKFVLHQIPSGVMHDHCACILGNGMVVDPILLAEEMGMLKAANINYQDRLMISPNAHLILPIHCALDTIYEERRSDKIGTTGKGIGPAYADKALRIGIRMSDLKNSELAKKIQRRLNDDPYREKILSLLAPNWLEEFLEATRAILPYVTNTQLAIHDFLRAKEVIVAEGGQGSLLDVDHGTYPNVTSSNTCIGGVLSGMGVSFGHIEKIIGVFKAYTTRVGGGPFPTELNDSVGEKICEVGKEYGSTTGRKRRCGWFDLELAKYSQELNGYTELAIMKIDVLTGIDPIAIGVHYKDSTNNKVDVHQAMNEDLRYQAVLNRFNGWDEPLQDIRYREDLPKGARDFLNFIDNQFPNSPIRMVSVGPERNQIIHF